MIEVKVKLGFEESQDTKSIICVSAWVRIAWASNQTRHGSCGALVNLQQVELPSIRDGVQWAPPGRDRGITPKKDIW